MENKSKKGFMQIFGLISIIIVVAIIWYIFSRYQVPEVKKAQEENREAQEQIKNLQDKINQSVNDEQEKLKNIK